MSGEFDKEEAGYTVYPDLDMSDDFDRAMWTIREEYSDHANIERELRFAKKWADSVMVDYDEGPCAIEFTKGPDKFWYLIGDACWDADDPRSEILLTALDQLSSTREKYEQAVRERDEARRERDVFSSDNLRRERDDAIAALREFKAKTVDLVLEHDNVVMERDALERRLQLQHVYCMHCGRDFGEHERGAHAPEVREHVIACSEHPLAKQRDSALRERDELRAEVERLLSIVANDMRDIERMKPVYEAAVQSIVHRKTADIAHMVEGWLREGLELDNALERAVNAAERLPEREFPYPPYEGDLTTTERK